MPPRHIQAKTRIETLAELVAEQAVEVASLALNVPAREIKSSSRLRARAAFARQIAMYLAHVIGQATTVDLAVIFGRDRSTVSHACAMIEERRDSALFDRQIEILERDMRGRVAFVMARYERDALRAEMRRDGD
ncbi:MAG: hypothetical protein K2Q06_09875 [Parvularculaceae bacterium]|nr:hypothetical protein [Parvularculaceae bacterium]